jgi:2-oxoglutarate dehydrogenase E1 component
MAATPYNQSFSVRNYITKSNEESFMNITSGSYMEEMFNLWLDDCSAVHPSWNIYFTRTLEGYLPGQAYESPPTIRTVSPHAMILPPTVYTEQEQDKEFSSMSLPKVDQNLLHNQFLVMSVIRGYQTRGHLIAKLDPLGMTYSYYGPRRPTDERNPPPKTAIHDRIMEFSQSELDTMYELPQDTYVGGNDKILALKEIFNRLENAYCQHVGVECGHIDSIPVLRWIRQNFEPPGVTQQSKEVKRTTLERLAQSQKLDEFLDKKWPTQPRFGLQGCDVLIPALRQLIDRSATMGAESIVIGTAHRGRMNILASVCERPLNLIFAEFFPLGVKENLPGDVKYHLGSKSSVLNKAANKEINVTVVCNPSHLEAVNPVVQGKAKAEQFLRNDSEGNKVVPILIHGDAGFSGQGIAYETLNLSKLPDYSTKGTIHVICNNQIGYTTSPHLGRSTTYSTDLGKILGVPIFHVNGNDPDAVIHCCNMASLYRNQFHTDVILDIIGYRRKGHSETDDPTPTDPVMYAAIKKTPSVLQIYSEQLFEEEVVTKEELENLTEDYLKLCEEEFREAEKLEVRSLKSWLDTCSKGLFEVKDTLKTQLTGVNEDLLMQIATKISTPPPEDRISLHTSVTKMLKGREDLLKEKQVNWVMAEALAFGTMLSEGIHVRLTGQDTERGTFSQRHHVFHDINKETVKYSPLTELLNEQAKFSLCNSLLSEYAALGFELGYSATMPKSLVIWEAQYGDFANNAQCIIDNFLSSGEVKWLKQTGLVMMLPHGMEGAGPDHSSARVERYLQMSSDDPDLLPDLEDKDLVMKQLQDINWFVANLTTPANLFHILRRQIALPFRKPLVLFTPKSILRHPEVISSISDLSENTELQRMIPESGPASEEPDKVEKLIFCSGKVYFDIKENRRARQLDDKIAIARIEQLCPFPYDLVRDEIQKYSKAALCWGQEEHKNSGAWSYVGPRIINAAEAEREPVTYAGRGPSASTASAVKPHFLREKDRFINECLRLPTEQPIDGNHQNQ